MKGVTSGPSYATTFLRLCTNDQSRDCSHRAFAGLKLAILGWYRPILTLSRRPTPSYIHPLSYQICTDLRGVGNSWKMSGNPPMGGPKQCLVHFWLSVVDSMFFRLSVAFFFFFPPLFIIVFWVFSGFQQLFKTAVWFPQFYKSVFRRYFKVFQFSMTKNFFFRFPAHFSFPVLRHLFRAFPAFRHNAHSKFIRFHSRNMNLPNMNNSLRLVVGQLSGRWDLTDCQRKAGYFLWLHFYTSWTVQADADLLSVKGVAD